MRLLVLADLHGRVPRWTNLARDAYDLVIVAGDLTNGNSRPHRLARFMDKLEPLAPFYYLPGNNDQPVFNDQDHTARGMTNFHRQWIPRENATGFPIVGHGGATTGIINYVAFTEEEMRANLEGLLESLRATRQADLAYGFILVTHDPPRDTTLDKTFAGEHVGARAVRGVLDAFHPLVAISGHIHEARGVERRDGTLLVNPGSCKTHQAAVITFDPPTLHALPPRARAAEISVELINL